MFLTHTWFYIGYDCDGQKKTSIYHTVYKLLSARKKIHLLSFQNLVFTLISMKSSSTVNGPLDCSGLICRHRLWTWGRLNPTICWWTLKRAKHIDIKYYYILKQLLVIMNIVWSFWLVSFITILGNIPNIMLQISRYTFGHFSSHLHTLTHTQRPGNMSLIAIRKQKHLHELFCHNGMQNSLQMLLCCCLKRYVCG